MRANKLMVVIHVVDPLQAFQNARIAVENGADGIFLINHDIHPEVLLAAYLTIRTNLSELWIGFNFLGVSSVEALRFLPAEADGFWRDNAGIKPYGPGPGFVYVEAERIKRERESAKRKHVQFFGGVAFKYQPVIVDLAKAANLATGYVDVITTSGYVTGSPPTLEKILEMRKGAPDKSFAIASGMTPENVGPFLEHVDYFLVNTGISKSDTELDPSLVYQMAKKMRR